MRSINATLLAEITKPCFYPIALVRIDWPGAAVEAHTGAGNISFDGGTFTGVTVGDEVFGAISVPGEQSGMPATEATLTLYGPYVELLDRLDPAATGRGVQIWAGATTQPGGNVLVGVPLDVFYGTISGDLLPAPTSDGSSGLIIKAKAGTHGRVKGAITHSNEDQQATYATDTYFERNARATAYRAAPPKW
mgnify:CR=1 FL=1